MDFIAENLGTVVSIIIAVGATYAAISSRLAKLETLIGELRRDVEKHNGVIERTYGLEADMKAVQVEVSTIKEAIDKGAA